MDESAVLLDRDATQRDIPRMKWTGALILASLVAACGGRTRAPAPADRPPTTATTTAPIPIGGCGAPTAGQELRTTDVDGNGRPEVCKYYADVDDPERPGQRKNVLVAQDLDVNWDGKVDISRKFGADGLVIEESWDADYDGNVDERRIFEKGIIVRAERDQDNDGRWDVVRFYEEGKLVRKETDTNRDGEPDRWEYFNGRTVERVGIDRDFDGTPDTWSKQSASS